MIKKENVSTSNKKPSSKKVIKLIIYIIVIGLLAFLSVKSCNLTLKALTPTATSWDDLNNVNIICNVNGNLSNELDSDDYYYLNNGNNTSGLAQTPAFQIYDTYNGLAYDEIMIRQTDIKLRGYLYDSQDNYSDYYERVIWVNDYISDNITPDTIRFENLSSDTPSNIVGANVYYPNALNPFSAFLNIINLNFILADTEITIYDGEIYDSGLDYDILYRFKIYVSEEENQIKYISFEMYMDDYETGTEITSQKLPVNIFYNDLKEYNNFRFYFNLNPDYMGTIESIRAFFTTKTPGPNNNYTKLITFNDVDDFPDDFPTLDINARYITISFEDIENYKTDNAYNVGYGAGYRVGREVGEDVGYNAGYQEGYEDGASGEINTNWILSLMNTATSILNIEILPNIKIIYLVGAFIILAFVKFVIGWLR